MIKELWLKYREKFFMFLLGLSMAVAMILITLSLTSCKSFKPIMIEGQPDECNDFYSTMSFYVTIEKGKDSAFIGTVYNECKIAREAKRKAAREKQCKELYFGVKDIDKENYKTYNQYLECTTK